MAEKSESGLSYLHLSMRVEALARQGYSQMETPESPLPAWHFCVTNCAGDQRVQGDEPLFTLTYWIEE